MSSSRFAASSDSATIDRLPQAPDVAAAIATFDWAATSLGPISGWPPFRRTLVDVVLRSRTPVATIWGTDGILIYNDAFARLVGQRHPDILGAPFRQAIADLTPFSHAAIDRVMGGEALYCRDQQTILDPSRADEPAWLTLSCNPIVDDAGTIAGALALVWDTTVQVREREAVDSALRQAQKMEAIGQLTGGVAHDFNNLLTGILGNLDMLSARLAQGETETATSYLEGARSAASRAAGLTHRLLAFSRRQTLMPGAVPVAELLADMAELIGRTVGPAIDVRTRCCKGVWGGFCDYNQLENALLNLAINARDAMPEGGTFLIEAENVTLGTPGPADDYKPGEYVMLAITDSGQGMSAEIVQRAFDPFFTTKPAGQGTGLGLSMVYGFVKQSDGHIDLSSRPGHGTTVRLYIPRHAATDAATQAESAAAPPLDRARPGETILIVDDEPDLCNLIAEMLEELGYAVLEACDAETGLDIVRSAARIDLLVADIGLPGGMNGTRFAEAARSERPGLPVLFVTGFDQADLTVFEATTALLQKPFTFENLQTNVSRLLEASRPNRSDI